MNNAAAFCQLKLSGVVIPESLAHPFKLYFENSGVLGLSSINLSTYLFPSFAVLVEDTLSEGLSCVELLYMVLALQEQVLKCWANYFPKWAVVAFGRFRT